MNAAIKKIDGRLFPLGAIRLLWNLKRTSRFRLILMGVLDRYRNMGIHIALIADVMRNAVRLGFTEAEGSLVVETNAPMLGSLQRWPVERSKTWRIYEMPLV